MTRVALESSTGAATALTGPLVSVVIPTHRRAALLERALRSALGQTYQLLEILVVENGDSHEAEAVVRRLAAEGAPVRWLYEAAGHSGRARNAGIRASCGAYVAFLDDDDVWHPEKLARQVALLERRPDADLAACKAWAVDMEGRRIKVIPSFDGEPTLRAFIEEGCVIPVPSSVVIRRGCFDQVGLFSEQHDYASDYEFFLRFTRRHRALVVPEALFDYTMHEAGMSKQTAPMLEDVLAVLRAARPAPELGVTRGLIHRQAARACYLLAAEAVDQRQYQRAAWHYLSAAGHDPLVGLHAGWSRSPDPSYRLLRPYAAALFYGLRALGARRNAPQGEARPS